jgi:hypothetical protein
VARAAGVSIGTARDLRLRGRGGPAAESACPGQLASSPANLSVEAQWLACQDICIPEHGVAQVTIRQEPNAAHAAPSASTALFTAAGERLPRPSPWAHRSLSGERASSDRSRNRARTCRSSAQVQFLPLTWGEIDNAAKQNPGALRRGSAPHSGAGRSALFSAPGLDGVLVLGPAAGRYRARAFCCTLLASGAGAPRAK